METKYKTEMVVSKIKYDEKVFNNFSSGYRRNTADLINEILHVLQWQALPECEKIELELKAEGLILKAEVEHLYQKKCIQRIVEDLYGITFIITDIKVKFVDRPSEIGFELKKELEQNTHINTNNIYIEVDGGIVILGGHVRTSDEDREVRVAAWSVPGVEDVVDQLRIGL